MTDKYELYYVRRRVEIYVIHASSVDEAEDFFHENKDRMNPDRTIDKDEFVQAVYKRNE